MRFDPERLEVLAGVRSHTDYRYKKLQEMETKIVLSPENPEEQAMVDQLVADLPSDEVEVETLPGMAAGASPKADVDAAAPEVSDVEPPADLPPAVAEEPEIEGQLEERLRRIIRAEVQQIVSEEISKRDEQQFQKARETKSVAHAMGFASNSSGNNSGTQKKWTPTLSFAGPGFKR